MKKSAPALLAIVAALAIVSCASGEEADVPDEQPAEQSVEAAEEIHPEVAGLVMTEQTPFVLRMRGDQWSTVQEYVEEMANAGSLHSRDRQALETFIADGPAAAIFDELGVESIDGVDPGRSVWMTAGILSAEDPVRAASVGLPWLPEPKDPPARFIRLIVPVDDPVAAAKSVEEPTETLETNTRVLPLERHIQIDVVDLADPRNHPMTQELWDKLDASGPQTTQTPALQAFLQHTGPVSFYARATQLRQFGSAVMSFETGWALETATPENRVQIRARGAALILNLHLMAPASQREFEDFALLGRSAGKAGLRVDMVATRTREGRRVYDEMNRDVSLPKFDEEALPQDRLLADLSWQGHFAAAAALLDDAGIDIADPEEKVSLEELLNGAVNVGQLLSNLRELKWTARSMGPWGLVGLAYSPTYLPRLGLSQLSDDLQALLPVAVRVRLIEPTEAQRKQAPAVGAMVVRFNSSVDALGGVIERHAKTVNRAKGVGVTHRIVAAPDGGAELHLAVGRPLEEVVLAEREPVPSGVSADVRGSGTQNPDGNMLGLPSALGAWHLRAAHSPTVARWALVSQAAASTPKALEASGELAQNSPACLDQLVFEGLELFEGMEGISISPTAEEVQAALAPYDAAAEACTKQAPEHAERIRWATGRARWFMAYRPLQYTLHGTRESIARCKADIDRSKGDDSWACRRLKRNWSEGNHKEKLQRAHQTATTLLEEACERGDQVACEQKGEVPEVSTLTWRPEK